MSAGYGVGAFISPMNEAKPEMGCTEIHEECHPVKLSRYQVS